MGASETGWVYELADQTSRHTGLNHIAPDAAPQRMRRRSAEWRSVEVVPAGGMVSREVWSARIVVDRRSVTLTYAVHGDHLPMLGPLAKTQPTLPARPRAVIWGVDLAEATTRRAATRLLRHRCRDAMIASFAQQALAHLFVIYSHGNALEYGSCLTAASQAASRLHAELERTNGRFVEVVVIDVSGWEDADALRDRILQTIATPAGVAGDVALGWHAITAVSIHRAAMAQLC